MHHAGAAAYSNTILLLNMTMIQLLKIIKFFFQCGYLTCGEEDDQDEPRPPSIGQAGLHW